jgi:hypothetical protein
MPSEKKSYIFKRSKIAPLCISIETVEVAFFVTGLETVQILGVEMSTGGSIESNVRSFEAFFTIYLSTSFYPRLCPQISECFKIMFLLSCIAINAVISI